MLWKISLFGNSPTLSDSELRLAKYALIQFRNALIAKGLPTEDVNALLIRLYK